MILRLIYAGCLKDATDNQLQKLSHQIIRYFLWACQDSSILGIDWMDIKLRFPDLYDYYKGLEKEWNERFPAPVYLNKEEKYFLDKGNKVDAIKSIRQRLQIGLLDAVEKCKEYYKSVGMDWVTVKRSYNLTDEEITLAVCGNRIQAIKHYRDRTGTPLLESKNEVEGYMRSVNLPIV